MNTTYTVTLKSTPASGYGWQLKQLPPLLNLQNTYYTPANHCQAGVTGCHGNQTFVFKVLTSGTGTLQWSYGRMWVPPSTISHCVDIIVQPSLDRP
ncbi:TPA: protease inhibitor I42 family protein [Serratia marcescens]|nr:protease inhibitor I42 family protein [Serratia marcescens]HBC7421397.1 protease inhibitor I42 family protein [Serratia marcescens]